MIEVKNLVKEYGPFKALKGVSFNVKKGEILSLLGSNGAGKTTIIKIITGLLKPTRGTALINNKSAVHDPEVKHLFGYMPEEPHLHDRITGREFLDMMASLRGMRATKIESRIDDLTKVLELSDMLDSEMGAYSKGMKQKVLFANAVIHDPKYLILDEPTSGLDPRFTSYIKDKIKNLAQREKYILMSTHITSVASEISDRVAIIDRGKIIREGKIPKLLDSTDTETLEEAFIEVVDHKR